MNDSFSCNGSAQRSIPFQLEMDFEDSDCDINTSNSSDCFQPNPYSENPFRNELSLEENKDISSNYPASRSITLMSQRKSEVGNQHFSRYDRTRGNFKEPSHFSHHLDDNLKSVSYEKAGNVFETPDSHKPLHLDKSQISPAVDRIRNRASFNDILPVQSHDLRRVNQHDTYHVHCPDAVFAVKNERTHSIGKMLRVADVFPPHLVSLWPFESFNAVQSSVLKTAAGSDDNMVLSAPTGCGKTVIFEMAIARLLQQCASSERSHLSTHRLGNQRVIYIAPLKTLCQQTLNLWKVKFAPLGLRLAEVTSDSSNSTGEGSMREIAAADIILTTPEKWDSVTRSSCDHAYLIGSVRLLLVDEVHMLNEDIRGATLEMIVTRMKALRNLPSIRNANLPATRMRMIALSATLPNIEDIASFFEAPCPFSFPDSYRPVPLSIHVEAFSSSHNGPSNNFLFDKKLTGHVASIVKKYSNGFPTLVFCGSRKDAENVAKSLATFKDWSIDMNHMQKGALAQASGATQDTRLERFLGRGVGIHHGAMAPTERAIIERVFLAGALPVLAATSTLALGVNLPARLVIIKGTTVYRGASSGYEEIPKSMLLQMMGRAGRPGYDSQGVAVIMTSKEQKEKLQGKAMGLETVESQLMPRLLEALNCEVHQGNVIHDVSGAISWLKATFFFIRVGRNPIFYGLPVHMTPQQLDKHLKERVLKALNNLANAGTVIMDEDGMGIEPTAAGAIYSRYMVSFSTMEKIQKLPADCSMQDLLAFVSSCSELSYSLRRSDKKFLNELNKEVRWPPPTKFKVKTSTHKAQTLLQAAAGGLHLDDWSAKHEQSDMIDCAVRVLSATSACLVDRGAAESSIAAQLLARSLRERLWEDAKMGQLKQMPQVGESLVKRLAARGIVTMEDMALSSPAFIDAVAGRHHPFGAGLRAWARKTLGHALNVRVKFYELAENSIEVILESRYPEYAPGGSDEPEAQHLSQNRAPRIEHMLYVYKKNMSSTAQESIKGTGPINHLYLCRKIRGPGSHHFSLTQDQVRSNIVLSTWIICTSMVGMDLSDICFQIKDIPLNGNSIVPSPFKGFELLGQVHETEENIENKETEKLTKTPEKGNRQTVKPLSYQPDIISSFQRGIKDSNDCNNNIPNPMKELDNKKFSCTRLGPICNESSQSFSTLKPIPLRMTLQEPDASQDLALNEADLAGMGIVEAKKLSLLEAPDCETSFYRPEVHIAKTTVQKSSFNGNEFCQSQTKSNLAELQNSTCTPQMSGGKRRKFATSGIIKAPPNSDLLDMLRHKGKEMSLHSRICVERLDGLGTDLQATYQNDGEISTIKRHDDFTLTVPNASSSLPFQQKISLDDITHHDDVDFFKERVPLKLVQSLQYQFLQHPTESNFTSHNAFRNDPNKSLLALNVSSQPCFQPDMDNKVNLNYTSFGHHSPNYYTRGHHEFPCYPQTNAYPFEQNAALTRENFVRPQANIPPSRISHYMKSLNDPCQNLPQSSHQAYLQDNRGLELYSNRQLSNSQFSQWMPQNSRPMMNFNGPIQYSVAGNTKHVNFYQSNPQNFQSMCQLQHLGNNFPSCQGISNPNQATNFSSKVRLSLDTSLQNAPQFFSWKPLPPLLKQQLAAPARVPSGPSQDVKGLVAAKRVPSGALAANAIRRHVSDDLRSGASSTPSKTKSSVFNPYKENEDSKDALPNFGTPVTPHRPSITCKNTDLHKLVQAVESASRDHGLSGAKSSAIPLPRRPFATLFDAGKNVAERLRVSVRRTNSPPSICSSNNDGSQCATPQDRLTGNEPNIMYSRPSRVHRLKFEDI